MIGGEFRQVGIGKRRREAVFPDDLLCRSVWIDAYENRTNQRHVEPIPVVGDQRAALLGEVPEGSLQVVLRLNDLG